jgi:hypothetical protein
MGDVFSWADSRYQDAQNDFDKVLERVVGIIRQPHTLWESADLAVRQTIQRIVFPKPLVYEQTVKKFRNPEKALIYGLFERSPPKKTGVVVWAVHW